MAHRLTNESRDRIVELYLQTHSVTRTAKMVHCSIDSVSRIVRMSPECMKIRMSLAAKYPISRNRFSSASIRSPVYREDKNFDPVAAGLCISVRKHLMDDVAAVRAPPVLRPVARQKPKGPVTILRVTRRTVNLDKMED